MEAAIFSPVCDALLAAGFDARLHGFSALDRYFGLAPLPFARVGTRAELPDLARLFEGLRYPGVAIADAALDLGGRVWYFVCGDADGPVPPSLDLLSFSLDWASGRFRDPLGIYPLLRVLRDGRAPSDGGPDGGPGAGVVGEAVSGSVDPLRDGGAGTDFPLGGLSPDAEFFGTSADAALLLARYGGLPENPPSGPGSSRQAIVISSGARRSGRSSGKGRVIETLRGLPRGPEPGPEFQRNLLSALLLSPDPGLGLELLRAAGVVDALWPELALLDKVDHAKEYHPEGNVWSHTLETFKYRKPAPGGAQDLRLSLGLLLHDAGKPLAARSGGRRFDGHAEIGAGAARRFLGRMGFDPALTEEVCFLVRNHMLPAALPRLPLSRTGDVIDSPLFPALLELYRCDESSSFRGPEGYYESSAAYRNYLRSQRNPYADKKSAGRRR